MIILLYMHQRLYMREELASRHFRATALHRVQHGVVYEHVLFFGLH